MKRNLRFVSLYSTAQMLVEVLVQDRARFISPRFSQIIVSVYIGSWEGCWLWKRVASHRYLVFNVTTVRLQAKVGHLFLHVSNALRLDCEDGYYRYEYSLAARETRGMVVVSALRTRD